MASVATFAATVRPGLARGADRASAGAAPKSAAMNGSGSAPAFLGAKPAQLSARVAAGRDFGRGSRERRHRGPFGLGLPEIVVIGGVAAVLFGPASFQASSARASARR